MSTWTNQAKNSATWASVANSDIGATQTEGSPIGLLLALTYSATIISNSRTWANQSKNSASWTNQTKN